MKKATLAAALFTLICCLAVTRDARAQSVHGYTSISYDEVSNVVTAYSETSVDYDLMFDYQAYVVLSVTDGGGAVKASATARDMWNSGFVSVVAQFSGAPDSTYTARGSHRAYAQLYDYDLYNRIFYYDYWFYGFYEGQGIYSPWWRSWLHNGFREVTRRSRTIPLGTTFDYDSVTTPGELKVTMSGAQTVKDGETAQFSVTVEGATATNYEWSARWPSGVGNSPSVTFNPATGSANTTATGKWFANPNQECAPSSNPSDPYYNAKYTIRCMVTFSNGKKKAAETTLTVNAYWNPAGSVAPAIIEGGPLTGFDSSRQLYVVVNSGTIARKLQPMVIHVPQTSQFYNKTVKHEEKHVEQWSSGMFSDLFLISSLMAQLSPLTDTTEPGLQAKIASTFTSWYNNQGSIYTSRQPAAEREAHAVSDPVPPKYIYQRCGRYQ